MSQGFERYERQYCEISANLSKKCTSAIALDGGIFNFLECLKIQIT
ncbi:VTI13 [Arabidopsis thaliana]|uniref:VTI13 n=1 Tax=Arabidopsis thaliana TaxID=3702 RepID=A0A178V6T5_ARATH|nr:VTI13 [Arabidopsis thaliana]